MSQELHYTSVARGLKPGARGFCTVAATVGLSPSLAERLESLSGYRACFPPDHPHAAHNPVAWSHLRISSLGQTHSVVSRIGPAGLDYTERPNKYAHHVVLESGERPTGGPAWLLEQPGFMASEWTGAPQEIPTGRRVLTGDRAGGLCRAWGRAAGDPGWAGVIAEAFLADPRRQVVVIFDPGVDLLPLFAEALALIPVDRRWEVTFQTYFTGLPPGVTCHWRGVVRDSAEARQAQSNPESLVIDLAEAGEAVGGALVHWAKTGQVPSSGMVLTSAVNDRPKPVPAEPTSGARKTDRSGAREHAQHDPYTLGPPPAPVNLVDGSRKPRKQKSKEKGGSPWPVIVALLVAFVLGTTFGGGGVYLLLRPKLTVDTNTANSSKTEPLVPPTKAASAPIEATPKVALMQPRSDEVKPPSLAPEVAVAKVDVPAPTGTVAPQVPNTRDGDGTPKLPITQSSVARPQLPSMDGKPEEEKKKTPAPNEKTTAKPAEKSEAPPVESPKVTATDKEPPPKLIQFDIAAQYSVEAEAKKITSISLIGGDDERWNPYRFAPAAENSGAEYEVLVRPDDGKGPPRKLGHFRWNEKQIEAFDWEKGVAEKDSAKEAFRDCALKVNFSDGSEEYLLLRDPKEFVNPPDKSRHIPSKKGRLIQWFPTSVSYTHLTLPTKRIV